MPCFIHSVFYCLFLRYFALGLLYHYNDQDSAALQVCTADISQLLVLTEESAQGNVLEFNMFPLCFFCFFLQFWTRVVDGDLQDSTRSDLYEYIVDFLCSCSHLDLVWKYADWALQKDPTV